MNAAVELPLPDLARMRRTRLDRLQAEMRRQDVALAVLLHAPHVTYATGYVPDAVDASHVNYLRPVAIVPAQGPARLHAHTTGRTPDGSLGALDAVLGSPLWPELDDGVPDLVQAIHDAAGPLTGMRIAVDSITGAMARADVFAGAELVDATRVLGPVRLCKTDDEVACIEHAQIVNERAMEVARARCVPGARRSEVAGAFLAELRRLGGDHNEIDPIFQVMPRRREDGVTTADGGVAFPTGIEDPVFAEGDLVWVDAGHGHEGYASDYGRTWIVGRAPDADEQACFEQWQHIMAATISAIRPGATLGDVGRAATDANGGERPWLSHFYVAHAVGLDSAEMPMIGSDLGDEFDDGYELAEGMILVLEPIVWRDGIASYRAEEIVVVTADGCRMLTSHPGYLPFEPPAQDHA
ncbi:MAG: Xaa-Pro peptidase family protein [Acidimicrobiales bacterium]